MTARASAGEAAAATLLNMTEDHAAELDELVAMLSKAGLLIETTEDGKPALQLTPKGAQVATQMEIGHEDDAAALLDALLDGGPSSP